jgi:hypothetical protein
VKSTLAGAAAAVVIYVIGAIADRRLAGERVSRVFQPAVAAWRWLLAAAAIVFTAIIIESDFTFQVVLVVIVAAYWTASERSEMGGRMRWLPRFVMWLGFLAAPCFLAAAFIHE